MSSPWQSLKQRPVDEVARQLAPSSTEMTRSRALWVTRQEEMEREELRVELALSEKARRKKLEELHHAALDVLGGIDAFEINMKRLVKGDQGEGE